MSLLENLKRSKPLHFTLIDPGKTSVDQSVKIAQAAYTAGTDAILLGGSTDIDPVKLDKIASKIRDHIKLPIILFPGNINGLTKYAHAVLYLTLMNSLDPYYITGVHVQAAPILLRMNLEVIPTSYIIIGYGGTVAHVGKALTVPNEKPELIASYALAGGYMGAKAIYLEAGSGAPQPVNPEGVKMAKLLVTKAGLDVLLIVGGGIRDSHTASMLVKSGADAVVTGTLAEKDPGKLKEVIEAVKRLKSS
ncbi:MAG: geranylgeranylglyceryl/heptaprenylglyceryl phosphate synthase [Desulfurococcales archaeon]|nr:geranylgeranylglyceryl/heptaprenylglyceryl phosphate synthase [Desulfurococcales archaeon]